MWCSGARRANGVGKHGQEWGVVMQRTESKKLIEIQLRFAERLVELSSDDLGGVVEKHTVFRQILGMPYGDEIRNQPLWQEFVDGLRQQSDRVNWAYEFHSNV